MNSIATKHDLWTNLLSFRFKGSYDKIDLFTLLIYSIGIRHIYIHYIINKYLTDANLVSRNLRNPKSYIHIGRRCEATWFYFYLLNFYL